jgi:hypothetical protein
MGATSHHPLRGKQHTLILYHMHTHYAYRYFYVNKQVWYCQKLFQNNFKYSNEFEIMYVTD